MNTKQKYLSRLRDDHYKISKKIEMLSEKASNVRKKIQKQLDLELDHEQKILTLFEKKQKLTAKKNEFEAMESSTLQKINAGFRLAFLELKSMFKTNSENSI